jgi:hypothetical protein
MSGHSLAACFLFNKKSPFTTLPFARNVVIYHEKKGKRV